MSGWRTSVEVIGEFYEMYEPSIGHYLANTQYCMYFENKIFRNMSVRVSVCVFVSLPVYLSEKLNKLQFDLNSVSSRLNRHNVCDHCLVILK